MLIKLNMANAFDRVKLSFLYSILHYFGFIPTFINLIKACTDKPWIAPLVNGRPTNFFQATRGLREGCPLLRFLYIIMADSLSRKLIAEKIAGIIPGITSVAGIEAINHVLFADDTLLLGGASLNLAKAFSGIRNQFCIVSGALINKSKSFMYGWNVDHSKIRKIS